METVEDVILGLNQLLYVEVLDHDLLERSVNQFTELYESKTAWNDVLSIDTDSKSQSGIVLMDFELYTKEKKEQLRLLKVEKVKQQDFEYAANLRDMEKECITYLKFKKHYGFEKSAFVLLLGILIYAYFGTAKNDLLIRGFLEKGKRLISMKIR